MTNPQVEIVVAVRNEQENAPLFVDAVRRLGVPREVDVSIFFVEDGSTDDTVAVLQELATADDVRFVSLEQGYGQAAAIWFGLSRSDADGVIMMDVDGQHPIEAIPEMIEHFLSGAMIVQGCRRDHTRTMNIRKLGATAFNGLVRVLTGVDLKKQTVFYRLVSREFKEEMLATPRIGRFLRVDLERADRNRMKMVYFDYVERTLGRSKYSFYRLVMFAFAGILSSISFFRFCLLAAGGLGAASALMLVGWSAAGITLFGLVCGMIYWYYRICTFDVLTLMRPKDVVESREETAPSLS